MLIEEKGDQKYLQETKEMIALRDEMAAKEQSLRKELQQSQQAVNLERALERAKQQQERYKNLAFRPSFSLKMLLKSRFKWRFVGPKGCERALSRRTWSSKKPCWMLRSSTTTPWSSEL